VHSPVSRQVAHKRLESNESPRVSPNDAIRLASHQLGRDIQIVKELHYPEGTPTRGDLVFTIITDCAHSVAYLYPLVNPLSFALRRCYFVAAAGCLHICTDRARPNVCTFH